MKMTDSNNNYNNHPHLDTLELDPADGHQYVLELRDRMFELLSTSQTVKDVEDRLLMRYPKSGLIKLALSEAKKTRTETLTKNHKTRHHSSSSSASFTGTLHNLTSIAMAKVSNLVREGVVGGGTNKAENEVSKFKMSIIEFIMNDVVNLACNFVKRQGNFIITRSDIRTAMHADEDLLDLFLSDTKSLLMMDTHPILAQIESSYSYNNHHDLANLTYNQKVRNMVDSENSFIRGLELIIKVFKVELEKYPNIISKTDVNNLFCQIDSLLELSTMLLTVYEDALDSLDHNDEVPYVGSEIFELAQAEEFHTYFLFTYHRLAPKENWSKIHQSVTKAYLNVVTNEESPADRKSSSEHLFLAIKHLLPNYLLNTVNQFFEYYKNINDLYELSRRHNNYDDELALKETLSILIKTKTSVEALLLETDLKKEVDYSLDPQLSREIRQTLEKRLEQELRNMPLPFMPPPEMYRFSEPDSVDNIQFEKKLNINRSFEPDQIPVIRCATLIKLVERLTYHKYQPNIVDSFLTTYRSFIPNPEELLDLLIERFEIPDPPLSVVFPDFYGSLDDLSEVDRTMYRQYLKRFRQEYSKPVKMRVINVLKSWIKNHYYDYERNPVLLDKLNLFLDRVYNTDKILRSLIVSIKKSIEQKKIGQRDEFEFMLSQDPPPILWWQAKANEPEKFNILTLHPVEFARQLTVVEFDLFRAIKPSELINVRDLSLRRKNEKCESSPNLSRMTRHFTLLSYWIRKCILEAEDFDKRKAIYNRAIEIMGVLRELNNFTGLLSIGSAIQSAPIERLSHTKKSLTHCTMKIMDDYDELNAEHQKKLQYTLKQCNPPCIPYLGSYQTKLIHAKEGNKTFIDEVDTTSPTLTHLTDDLHSSFSNSPATPISPHTPLNRMTNLPQSATSTLHDQFFGDCHALRSMIHLDNSFSSSFLSNGQGSNMNSSSGGGGGGTGLKCHNSNSSNHSIPLQPPPTPGPSKMINFTKQRIRAGLVAEISNYQNLPYCLKVQPDIKHFIESIETEITNFAANLPGGTHATYQGTTDDDTVSIKNSVPAITKRLDDYLFEQSEKIEPKHCTKPPRSKTKVPDCYKSPGIKVNSCTTPK